MPPRAAVTRANVAVVAVVLAAVAVAIFALTRVDRTGEQGSGLDEAFDYQIAAYKSIDPTLIHYRQALEFPSGMKSPRGIAVDSPVYSQPEPVYVAGDQAIRVFAADGTFKQEIPLADSPYCLAVADLAHVAHALADADEAHTTPGRIYVGMKDHVVVLDESGKPLATWESLGPKALLTSIALGNGDVFVADAGNRVVLRYDASGKLLGRIGGSRGFAIPQPVFSTWG